MLFLPFMPFPKWLTWNKMHLLVNLLRCPTYTGSTGWQDLCRWTKTKNKSLLSNTHKDARLFPDEDGKSRKDVLFPSWLIRTFYIWMGEQHIFPKGGKKVHKEHRMGCFHSACWDIFIWPLKPFFFFPPFRRKCLAAQLVHKKLQEVFVSWICQLELRTSSHIFLKS